jgi:hypothetical protein
MDTSNFELVDHEIGHFDESDNNCRVSLVNEGYQFLTRHSWCLSVRHSYLCELWEGILAILYFEIEPASTDIDDSVWIIAGDISPAYIDVAICQTVRDALEAYIDVLQDWIDAVLKEESVSEMMPLYVRYSMNRIPATPEYANLLQYRVKYIRDKLLPELA